ncbi:hypothetical protein [Ktedonospora formicarum]|uniref:Uncharacterized protein n=1 Tax=Ktedonospora formicarum TaxID=2778364 RepID=A0A8J3MWA5_9CHLR|nr:hypothetical protein [Ktedonospora formicarum]GHO47196.1 hypothetical protein KSX_53590 [Ktedonospora formicarum]GHO48776.1 hypothetical protein KSX_69390 [Ktedonospora formicarum]
MLQTHMLSVKGDTVLRNLVARNLMPYESHIQCACTTEGALPLVRKLSFPLILLDINHSELTGQNTLHVAQLEHLKAPFKDDADTLVEKLPMVNFFAMRRSSRHLESFHSLDSLPKLFPMDVRVRLAAKATQRQASGALPSVSSGDEREDHNARYRD